MLGVSVTMRKTGWLLKTLCFGLALLFTEEIQAETKTGKGVIWVDMSGASPKYKADDFIKALELRLPNWKIERLRQTAEDGDCPTQKADHYLKEQGQYRAPI